jgi:hypothetical protein
MLCALLLGALVGCDKGSANDPATTTAASSPMNEIDVMINAYEKAANVYAKTARKLRAGDVSLTVRYMDQGKAIQELQAKLRETGPKMTPPQTQRVAAISARVGNDLPK